MLNLNDTSFGCDGTGALFQKDRYEILYQFFVSAGKSIEFAIRLSHGVLMANKAGNCIR